MSERIRRRYLALVLIVTVVLGFIIVWPLWNSELPTREIEAHSNRPERGSVPPTNSNAEAPRSIGSSGQ